jgi:hypothetical protein
MTSGDGHGKLWAIRLWETETINKLGWSEVDWCELSTAERYRKVCAAKLGKWMQSLETAEAVRKMKAKSGK